MNDLYCPGGMTGLHAISFGLTLVECIIVVSQLEDASRGVVRAMWISARVDVRP